MTRRNLDALHEPSRPKYGETHTPRPGAGTYAKPKIVREEEDDPVRVSAVEQILERLRNKQRLQQNDCLKPAEAKPFGFSPANPLFPDRRT